MKFKLLFALLPLLVTGCASLNSTIEQGTDNPPITHKYEISETSFSIKENNSKRLYISDNGTITNNVTWSSNNTQVASVTSDGNVIAIKSGKANITGTIDAENQLSCMVTVTASSSGGSTGDNDTAVVKFFKAHANYVMDDGNTYVFVSFKSKYDYQYEQTFTWNFYFYYDTSDDFCMLKSEMHGLLSSGKKFYYYGINAFYWNDYKGGLFKGGYCQETGVDTDEYATMEVTFDNSSIVFRTDHTLVNYYDIYYTTTKNEFTSDPTDSQVLTMFSRVTECCDYGHEVFTNYSSTITLY